MFNFLKQRLINLMDTVLVTLYTILALCISYVLWNLITSTTSLLFCTFNSGKESFLIHPNQFYFINIKLFLSTLIELTPFIFIFFGILFFLLVLINFNYVSFWAFCVAFVIFWSWTAAIAFVYIIIVDLGFCKNLLPDVSSVTANFNFTRNWFVQPGVTFNIKIHGIYYLFVISIISVFANLHTLIYMTIDQKKERFVLLLNAFSFSMLFLTLSTDWVSIIFFWELLGVTSFYLITHNETQTESLRASFKAFCFNLISDVLFVIAFILYLYVTNSLYINTVTISSLMQASYVDNTSTYSNELLTKTLNMQILLSVLFVASIIKSVQIFTFMWLPESMKAPVPASALIHSATLVAAGFLILIETKGLYINFFNVEFLVFVGFSTAIGGSIAAAYQEDLKKILAFSTIANCGFMLVLLYIFDIRVFLIYFAVHGIFKSICFMFSGEIINYQNHNQDFRTYGTTSQSLLVNLAGVSITLLLLAGFPFTLVYIVKHYFEYTLEFEISWNVLSTLSLLYAAFSLCYSVIFIVRVFVFSPTRKLCLDIANVQNIYDYRTTNNLIYSLLSLVLTHTILTMFTYYQSFINTSIYTNEVYCAWISIYFIGNVMAVYFIYTSGALNITYASALCILCTLYCVWFCIIFNCILSHGIPIFMITTIIAINMFCVFIFKKLSNNINLYYEII